MAHPCEENGLTLIRLVDGSIDASSSNSGGGTLKLYTATHHQSPEEVAAHRPASVTPAMTPEKLFVIRGRLWWEMVPAQNCLVVWIGFSTRPMFGSIRNPLAYSFMTDYKRVLLPPPGTQIGRTKIYNYTRH